MHEVLDIGTHVRRTTRTAHGVRGRHGTRI